MTFKWILFKQYNSKDPIAPKSHSWVWEQDPYPKTAQLYLE